MSARSTAWQLTRGLAVACALARVPACAETRRADDDAGVAESDGGRTLDAGGGDDAGNADGGATLDAGDDAGAARVCEFADVSREPGPAIVDLDQHGQGACANTALGSAIDAVHAAHPELDDVRELFVPDPERFGDQSFIYAFALRDGGFALVFRRGGGDCPAGCTENEYYYFRTDDNCDPQSIAEFLPTWSSSGCMDVSGIALWDHPPPPDPLSVCGVEYPPWAPPEPQSERACGQRMPCSTKGGADAVVTALDFDLQYTTERDASDPSRATLTLLNTGHPALDGRALPARIERWRVHVMEMIDRSTSCVEQEEIEVLIDYQGHADSFVRYFEVSTPDCAGAPGDYCKGGLDLSLGNLTARSCTARIDIEELGVIEASRHDACTVDADCALVTRDRSCISLCPIAVSASYADELTVSLERAADARCFEADCSLDEDCGALEAVCVESRCERRAPRGLTP